MQKPLVKRTVGQQDPKLGNKFCGPVNSETFQPFFSDGSLMDDKTIDTVRSSYSVNINLHLWKISLIH